ncbi:MAG: hypothetical protein HY901_02385 [Deltaproteobacteria bacterium]|nr:hypothetical protein [Deltaproteobacteria bacterium]
MPIYVVRWPDLSAALVKARSEEELLDILDEVADSTGCSWSVYNGPLFVEFELPVEVKVEGSEEREEQRPIRPDEVAVGSVSDLYDYDLKVSAPSGDTVSEMFEAVEKAAFPNVYAARHSVRRKGEPSEKELKAAVLADLEVLIKASWQRSHLEKNEDPDAALARMMGAPLRLVKQWRERFIEGPPPEQPPAKPKTPSKPRKK